MITFKADCSTKSPIPAGYSPNQTLLLVSKQAVMVRKDDWEFDLGYTIRNSVLHYGPFQGVM